jgi:predicted phosphodiesterase
MARRAAVIRGNVENKICQLARDPQAWRKLLKKKKTAHLAWTAPRLGKHELAWLEALPAELELRYAGVDVLVVHGSPRRDDDYIFVSVTPAALGAKLGDRCPDVLICGHSHVPFVKTVGGVLVVNCGSVGRPVDGDPRGSYALGEFQRGRPPRLQIVRFAYPLDELAADLEQRQVPFADADEYRQGIKTKGA